MLRHQRNGDTATAGHNQNGELKRLLVTTGLSQGRLAKLIDAHPNTVSRWASGRCEVPGAVLAYLRLYRDVKALLDRD